MYAGSASMYHYNCITLISICKIYRLLKLFKLTLNSTLSDISQTSVIETLILPQHIEMIYLVLIIRILANSKSARFHKTPVKKANIPFLLKPHFWTWTYP